MKKKDFILIGVLAALLVGLLFVGKGLKNARPKNITLNTNTSLIQFVTPQPANP
ncbi:MAG: hypothetical protein Q4C53_05010 [Clostridia bacterium]|nr:hypothetical protein [Clostridia bacterium]